MTEYFKLQFRMTNRKLTDYGIHPVIGYTLLLILFIGFSLYLFYKTQFAPYIYILIALYFVIKLSEFRRNDYLKMCFNNKNYRQLRTCENLMISLPFTIFLIYKAHLLPTIILLVISILLALFNFKNTYNLTIPTPFSKRPFEFTVGFRNTFFLFIISYTLTIIAIAVDNYNLGIFALLLIFLCTLTYYLKPENEYFIWSYNISPSQFLIDKIKTALLFSSCLCLPILCALGIFYFESITILLICMLLGYLYLIAIILAKYAAYPEEMGLIQAILLSICLAFPPMLIVVIPYFANQSITKLKEFLK